jgi:CheY-like chemotaxis protein
MKHRRAHDRPTTSSRQTTSPHPRGVSKARPWIVLYEPNPRTRRALVQRLTEEGWAALACDDPAQAMAAARSGRTIDALLVDLKAGIAVAEEVRRVQPGVRVLFTSSHDESARYGVRRYGSNAGGETSRASARDAATAQSDIRLVESLLGSTPRTARKRVG